MDYFVYYGLTFITIIITLVAQIFVSYSYSKYSKIKNKRGLTGYDVARYILDKNNLKDVKINKINGNLTDHYDPKNKVVNLSTNVYEDNSIGSIAVACHECGHAIQDKQGYIFMRLRASLVPIVNFSSYAGYIAIVIGLIFSSVNLIWTGIILEAVILLFQLVTLPVEIDASKKALKELDYNHFLDSNELNQSKTMLTAAAFTYVASVANTLIQILRLILIFGNRDE